MKLKLSTILFIYLSCLYSYTISGFIKDGSNGEPLSYTNIVLLDQTEDNTGSDGCFDIAETGFSYYNLDSELPQCLDQGLTFKELCNICNSIKNNLNF